MHECTLCNGTGLIGSGERPELHQGALRTCPDCKGTGKLPDKTSESEAPAAEAQAPAKPKGFIGRVLEKAGL
jgi:DnaJ-class molecular chaperone